jgi:hypothetical protein
MRPVTSIYKSRTREKSPKESRLHKSSIGVETSALAAIFTDRICQPPAALMTLPRRLSCPPRGCYAGTKVSILSKPCDITKITIHKKAQEEHVVGNTDLILQMSNIPTLDIRFCPYNVTFIFAYPS